MGKKARGEREKAGKSAGARARRAGSAPEGGEPNPSSGEAGPPQGGPDTDYAAPGRRWEMIAQAAYYRAEGRGFAPGREWEDWFTAETEVDARLSVKAGAAKAWPDAMTGAIPRRRRSS